MVGAPVLVGLAEIQAINGAALLTCLGLGSCVSVCALDPTANVSGMAHIMLPCSPPDANAARPATFADTGVAELISSMEKLGAEKSRMVCAIAGGASLRSAVGDLDMGRKTAEAVMLQLKNMGIKCTAVDLGGNVGRTVTMSSDSGKVVVSTINHGDNVLCNLRSAA